VRQLASHGAHVFLAARTEAKALKTIDAITTANPKAKITFIPLDLSSFSSVKQAASTFTRSSSRLDILLNNAGIMACPPGLTEEGYEIQFGTNHMGHALLTKLLLPTMLKTAQSDGADVRIVTLSGGAINMTDKEGLVLSACTTDMSSHGAIERYGQSKLANLLYSDELANQYPSLTCVTVNPGFVNTGISQGPKNSWPFLTPVFNLANTLFSKSVEEGVKSQLWAATVKKAEIQSGQYYEPVGVVGNRGKHGGNVKQSKALWKWTQDEFERHGV
jgi:retinol dehydrogenase-12